jgi:hypothetical protein
MSSAPRGREVKRERPMKGYAYASADGHKPLKP